MPATWKQLAYKADVLPDLLSPYVIGDLIYASSTSALNKLAGVAVGSVLVSGGIGAAPAWSAAPSLTTSLTVPLIIAPAAALAIRPTTDAVTAIQLQDKDGNSILNVDTTNNRVGIGDIAPPTVLFVKGSGGFFHDSDLNAAGEAFWGYTNGGAGAGVKTAIGYFMFSQQGASTRAARLDFYLSNGSTPALAFRVDKDKNMIMGGATIPGTSGAGALVMAAGTAPSTAPADLCQLYVTDINAAAGYAGLHKRTETTNQVEIVPGVIIKTDTGSPANPYEGLMEINTFDNKVRMYADAGWRELGTW